MPDLLPGFNFDRTSHRYRDLSTGRFVARQHITGLLDNQVQATAETLTALTTAAHEGRLAPAAYVEQMRTEVRRLTLQNAALGAGGFDKLTQSDYGRVGAQLRGEYQRIVQFAEQMKAGEVTLPQALNRAEMYAGTARKQFWEAEAAHVEPSEPGMAILERRLLGVAEHCEDCTQYYDQGWQPLGVLPEPGQESACMSNCKCKKVRMEVRIDEADEWIGTKRQWQRGT